jgi:hypothetical protein
VKTGEAAKPRTSQDRAGFRGERTRVDWMVDWRYSIVQYILCSRERVSGESVVVCTVVVGVDWADGSGAAEHWEDSVVIISDAPKPGEASL